MRRMFAVCGFGIALLTGCAGTGTGDSTAPSHEVVLQVRSGAGGGNPNRIDMNGSTTPYVKRFSATPIDLATPVSMGDESVAYCTDGRLKVGQVFVVTEVAYQGTSRGDSNGHGEFKVVVGGETLAHSQSTHLPTGGTWRGRIEIRPVQQANVFLEVANSSMGEARIRGHLVTKPVK